MEFFEISTPKQFIESNLFGLLKRSTPEPTSTNYAPLKFIIFKKLCLLLIEAAEPQCNFM